MIAIYGLRNCDTCRKARAWFSEQGVAAGIHDLRKDGVPAGAIDRWSDAVGWQTLLNRRGTTWRGLSEEDRADLDADKARRLMADHPALIKRPVIELDGSVLVGFTDDVRDAITQAR